MHLTKSTIIWALLWLNAVLLIGWALKVTAPPAEAQLARPSDYLMIPGEIIGANASSVYILDTVQGRLSAVNYDDSQNRLSVLPPLDINALFQGAVNGPGGPARGY